MCLSCDVTSLPLLLYNWRVATAPLLIDRHSENIPLCSASGFSHSSFSTCISFISKVHAFNYLLVGPQPQSNFLSCYTIRQSGPTFLTHRSNICSIYFLREFLNIYVYMHAFVCILWIFFVITQNRLQVFDLFHFSDIAENLTFNGF